MPTFLQTKSIYYKDVNLIPKKSVVKSRTEIKKELNRIFVSPMSAIVTEKFAIEASRLGLSVCLHRFCDPQEEVNIFNKIENKENVFCAVGLDDWDRVNKLIKTGCQNFLLDVANGYLNLYEFFDKLNNIILIDSPFGKINKLMAGNVACINGVVDLFKSMSVINNCQYLIRCGIANGAACSTSEKTGVNRGQITEIKEIFYHKHHHSELKSLNIIADGGIRDSGDAAKSFGCGADGVMMGYYFSQSFERNINKGCDQFYWGGASDYQHQIHPLKQKRHSEGKMIELNAEQKFLSDLIDDFWGGLSSSVSYCGYSSLTDFIGNGVLELKYNS